MDDGIERPGAQQWVPEGADIDALKEAAKACRGCELWEPASQIVFSAGPPSASMVLVGEQPGDQEDRRGMPFVGPAGTLLVQAVRDAGIDPATVYRTNAVKHFRFELRGTRRLHKTPEAVHITACHPWLHAELQQLAPGMVVALGATAGRALFGRPVRIGAERGRVLEGAIPDSDAKALLTAHPSAVLRMRDDPGYDAAYAALVTDLKTAAAAAG
ncbi:UdgX family uracil-DNA binding protein [Amnibacterium sp.]|uniref:UdgX family uracil-DNA binding protein n=1 Tax=Amnibacterium sp. TaxID=1872496 RepID=UPI0026203910|nr:UdgX family uracil-DNA binding protein [Amnibacterium sp.]MCU1474984.1 phage polymerase-related protein [Amnibacterium sp.]